MSIRKKAISTVLVAALTPALIISPNVFASTTSFSELVTFGANSRGFASSNRQINFSGSSGFQTLLTQVNFVGMPSGIMPAGAEVYFRLYKTNRTTKATNYNFHNANHLANGTWKTDTFLSGITHNSDSKFVIASNSSSSLGATVSVEWHYY